MHVFVRMREKILFAKLRLFFRRFRFRNKCIPRELKPCKSAKTYNKYIKGKNARYAIQIVRGFYNPSEIYVKSEHSHTLFVMKNYNGHSIDIKMKCVQHSLQLAKQLYHSLGFVRGDLNLNTRHLKDVYIKGNTNLFYRQEVPPNYRDFIRISRSTRIVGVNLIATYHSEQKIHV